MKQACILFLMLFVPGVYAYAQYRLYFEDEETRARKKHLRKTFGSNWNLFWE